MNDRARLTNIDALRGIASLAVCWFHLTNGYSGNSVVRISGKFGWLGVEVFFVISGFIIPYALFKGGYQFKKGWGIFMWKRILRIEPPYFLAVILALVLWHLSAIAPHFNGMPPPSISSLQVWFHLGYLNGIFGYLWLNPVFWTLAIEFQYYILISIIFCLISSNNQFVLIASNILLLCISIVFNDNDIFVFKYLGLFLFGIAAFQYKIGLINKITLIGFLVVIGIAIFVERYLVVSVVGLVTTFFILCNFNIGKRPLLFLGGISYSLYLVHVPIGGRVINLGKRYIETEVEQIFLSLIALLVSVIAAYFFCRMVEKPAQVWASQFKY